MSAPQIVEGLQIPALASPEAFRSAIAYKPRDDDLFIATYPKCGTTWAQQTVALIFRHGQPLEADWMFNGSSPYLEFVGAHAAETMPRPGAIKIHLPFHLAPWSDKAKYIYVTRNPKDTCVSYYHHMKDSHGFSGTFNEFFEMFLSGKIDYSDYFDHLLGWYEHRNDPNVLFVTYEEMKKDPEAAILKMASFIDDEKYAKPLRQDRQKLENVLKYSSFQEMKDTINKKVEEIFGLTEDQAAEAGLPDELVNLISKINAMKAGGGDFKPNISTFIRKGIVGDWRNYFDDDQSRRMDDKFAQRTKDTDIADFWKEYM